jgi:hypothetical protein
MTCRCCHCPAHWNRLCLGHALLYCFGPWRNVEEFILTKNAGRG